MPEGCGPFLGVDWLDGYRVAVAQEALRERTDWDVPKTQSLQMDTVNLHWQEVRDVVTDAVPQLRAACEIGAKIFAKARRWARYLYVVLI